MEKLEWDPHRRAGESDRAAEERGGGDHRQRGRTAKNGRERGQEKYQNLRQQIPRKKESENGKKT